MGPRAGLDGRGKSRPRRDSIPGPSSPSRIKAMDSKICKSVFVFRNESKLLVVYVCQLDGRCMKRENSKCILYDVKTDLTVEGENGV